VISRRLFLGGLAAGISAPAIVRADSLMKLRQPRCLASDELIGLKQSWLYGSYTQQSLRIGRSAPIPRNDLLQDLSETMVTNLQSVLKRHDLLKRECRL
jgi:hypothetical protein